MTVPHPTVVCFPLPDNDCISWSPASTTQVSSQEMEAAAACAAPMSVILARLRCRRCIVALLWEQISSFDLSWVASTTVFWFQLHKLLTQIPKNDLVSEAHHQGAMHCVPAGLCAGAQSPVDLECHVSCAALAVRPCCGTAVWACTCKDNVLAHTAAPALDMQVHGVITPT